MLLYSVHAMECVCVCAQVLEVRDEYDNDEDGRLDLQEAIQLLW